MSTPTHPLQSSSFDPLAMLRQNRGDSTDVRVIKLRMLWLRKEVPQARVSTSLVSHTDALVVMAASIALPDGGTGAGHAASRISDGADIAELIETTELRAIGRALDILGYVVTDQQETPTPSDRPARQPAQPNPPQEPAPARTPSSGEQHEQAPEAEQPKPQDDRASAPGHVQAIRTLRNRGATPSAPDSDRPAPQERPSPAGRPVTSSRTGPTPIAEFPPSSSTTASQNDDPALEDISWTAFWDWARARYQFTSRVQLEELLGQSIAHKSPAAVRKLLLEHFAQENPPES